MKKVFLFCILGLFAEVLSAQTTTTISATVVDSDGSVWSLCKWRADLVGPGIPFMNGVRVTATSFSGACDAFGSFTQVLPTSSLITPSGFTWQFTIASNTSAQASTGIFIPTVGGSQNISSAVNSQIVAPRFPAAPTAYGYADAEITPIPLPGGQYFNTGASPGQRVWSGVAWGSGSGSASINAAPQYRLFLQPNTGTNAIAGPATTATNAQAPMLNSVKDASQYCTTAGTLDQSCINNALVAGTTIQLAPGTYNFNSTINVTQNNVTLTCLAGAVMFNNQTASPAPMFNVTGNNFTISPGCVLDNGSVFMTFNNYPSIYDAGVITVNNQGNPQVLSPNFSGVIMKNCNTAACISAFNINGGKFDQMTLAGNLSVHTSAGNSQGFEAVGGSMYQLGIDVLSFGGTVKNVTISGVNLTANGGDSACGSIGDYSGGNGFLSNISITGTVCTIQNTAQATITNAAVSGGTITLTLSAASPFFQGEQVTMSSVAAPFTCLNGKDLAVSATSGSTVSFPVGSTGCTGSGAVTGTALAAAFAAWTNPSWTMTSSTLQGNTVQFAPGTNQYIQYAVLEMGCSNCSVKDNIINTPDAFGQNYSCITAYSGGMKIEGNLCNGFGATGGGIGVSAHTSYNTPLVGNFSSIKNNTIINNVAAGTSSNLQPGVSVNCNLSSGSTQFADVSGNKIYGAFWRGVSVTSTGGGTCTVSAKVEGNEIYNAVNAVNAYNATLTLGPNMYSGVTNQFVNQGLVTLNPTIVSGPMQLSAVANAASLGTDASGNIVASSSNQVLIGSSSFNLSTTTSGCYRILTAPGASAESMGGSIDLIEGYNANIKEVTIHYSGGDFQSPGVLTVIGDPNSQQDGWITSVVASNSGAGSNLNIDICAATSATGRNLVKANFYGFGILPTYIVASPVIGATAGSSSSSVSFPGNFGGPYYSQVSNGLIGAVGVNASTGYQIGGTAPSGHALTGNGTYYMDGGATAVFPIAVSATTTASTTDLITVTGMTPSGHCSVDPTNATAATNAVTTYINARTTNQITLTHTATAGMTYDIICTPY